MALTSGSWSLTGAEGVGLMAGGVTLSAAQADVPTRYTVVATAPELRPGAAWRARLRIPEDWPLTFDAFRADMTMEFDRTWDRRAIEERRPQPTRIVIRHAEAVWGELRIKAAAELDVDQAGYPTGTLSLQARNWREMLALAEASGVLAGGLRQQAERALSTLASLTGNPNAIDVQLNFAGGLVAVGFIPLGPAPRLFLR